MGSGARQSGLGPAERQAVPFAGQSGLEIGQGHSLGEHSLGGRTAEQAQAFTTQNRDREAFSRLAGQVRLGADQQHRPLSRDRGFVLTQRPTRLHAEQHEIGG